MSSPTTNPLAHCTTKEQVLEQVAAGKATVEQAVATSTGRRLSVFQIGAYARAD